MKIVLYSNFDLRQLINSILMSISKNSNYEMKFGEDLKF